MNVHLAFAIRIALMFAGTVWVLTWAPMTVGVPVNFSDPDQWAMFLFIMVPFAVSMIAGCVVWHRTK